MYSQVNLAIRTGNSQKNGFLDPWQDYQWLVWLQLQQLCLHQSQAAHKINPQINNQLHKLHNHDSDP